MGESGHRRQWIIDRGLQFRLILLLVATGAVNFLFFVFALHYLADELLPSMAGAPATSGAGLAVWQQALVYRGILVGLGLQVALLVLLGVYFSNRISGPIYRLNAVLKQLLAGGAAPVVKLRRHDFMRELSDNINAVLLHYHDLHARLRQELEKLMASPKLAEAERQRLRWLIDQLKAPSPPAAS